MVYCGKPSRGCQCCKTRRIKCDEARPACGNCKKSGRECPGYPDEFDLIFRNETSATKKRAQKATNRNRSNTSVSRSTPSTNSDDSTSPKSPKRSPPTVLEFAEPAIPQFNENVLSFDYSKALQQTQLSLFDRAAADPAFPAFDTGSPLPNFWPSSVPQGLEYSVESAATAFFFRNFVALPQKNGSCRGFLEYLIPMYNRDPTDSPLQLATHTVALSALSNYPGNQRLKFEARRAYGKALKSVNEAIHDPVSGTSDQILLSILMFSLYEAVASTSQMDTAWANHIDGAVAIAKMRGGDGWKTEESIGLFRAVRMCMLTSAIQRAKPVDEFPGPKGWMCDDNYEQNPANRLALISLGLPNIRRYAQDVVTQSPCADRDAEILHLVKTAQEIDGQLEHWYLTLPDSWGHRTVRMQLEEPADLYNDTDWQGPVHTYDDLFVVNIINDYRVSRAFCQQIILGITAALSDPETRATVHGTRQHAVYVARSMADDVCSSVPFHMEIALQEKAHESEQDMHAAEATGGYFLSWPLFAIATVQCIPERQREWIRGRLYRIGQDFGLSRSQMLMLAQRQVLTSSPSFP